jgi:hypothetical protein
MVVFKSEPQRTTSPAAWLIGIGIFAVALIGIFFLARAQKEIPPQTPGAPVVIPGMARKGDPNFEYYKTRVRIEDVKASLGISFNKSRIAIISGVIVNDGDRKLEAVELHLSLYDVFGQLSKDRVATPLRPGIGLNRPMEPLEKRTFTVWMEPIEQFWNPKQVQYELTGLKYQ